MTRCFKVDCSHTRTPIVIDSVWTMTKFLSIAHIEHVLQTIKEMVPPQWPTTMAMKWTMNLTLSMGQFRMSNTVGSHTPSVVKLADISTSTLMITMSNQEPSSERRLMRQAESTLLRTLAMISLWQEKTYRKDNCSTSIRLIRSWDKELPRTLAWTLRRLSYEKKF